MVTGMESHRESISSNLFVHFVAGGFAGITAASATYPLDLVRTRLAAQVWVFFLNIMYLTLTSHCWFHGWSIIALAGYLTFLSFESMTDKRNLLHGYLAYPTYYLRRRRYLGTLQGTWNNACGIFHRKDDAYIISIVSFHFFFIFLNKVLYLDTGCWA